MQCCGNNDCENPIAWIRHTQFAGSHPFCDEHARKETNFLEDNSYLFWEEIESPCDV